MLGAIVKRRMASLLAVAAVCFCSLGVTNAAPQAQFVAKTSTLTPAPYVASPVQPVVVETVVNDQTPATSYSAPQNASGAVTAVSTPELSDWIAAVIPGNNCVACVRAMTGRSQNGNAGSWSASHSTPHPGDIMIFRAGQQGAGSAGHVGVVAWTDGYHVKLRHCNWSGGQVDFVSTGNFW